MIRVLMLVFGLGFSVSAAADLNICLNLFSFTTLQDKFVYTSIHNTQKAVSFNGQANSGTMIVGRATLVGKEIGMQTRPVALIDYTVRGDFLTISSARIPSEFTGDGVYRQLLEKILADNPQVNIIMTSLTGKFYEEYLVNLAFVENKMEALPLNKTDSVVAIEFGSVFAELRKLGFTHVRSSTVLENFGGPFVRFSVTR